MMTANEALELSKVIRAELEPRKVKELVDLMEVEMLKKIKNGAVNICKITVTIKGIDKKIIHLAIEETKNKGYKVKTLRQYFPEYINDNISFYICWNQKEEILPEKKQVNDCVKVHGFIYDLLDFFRRKLGL